MQDYLESICAAYVLDGRTAKPRESSKPPGGKIFELRSSITHRAFKENNILPLSQWLAVLGCVEYLLAPDYVFSSKIPY